MRTDGGPGKNGRQASSRMAAINALLCSQRGREAWAAIISPSRPNPYIGVEMRTNIEWGERVSSRTWKGSTCRYSIWSNDVLTLQILHSQFVHISVNIGWTEVGDNRWLKSVPSAPSGLRLSFKAVADLCALICISRVEMHRIRNEGSTNTRKGRQQRRMKDNM